MHRVLADRLIDLCARHADEMAQQWRQALTTNLRTKSFATVNREACQRHAVQMYRNLGQMYLSKDPFQAVVDSLDVAGMAEDLYGRGVPVEEVVYALILMRRQIWLFSEQQALYVTPGDMNEVVVSINRVTLLFDYAIYRVVTRYREMSRAPVARL